MFKTLLFASADDAGTYLSATDLNTLYEEKCRLSAEGLNLQPKILDKGFVQSTPGRMLTALEALAASKQLSGDYHENTAKKKKSEDTRERKKVATAEKKATEAKLKKKKVKRRSSARSAHTRGKSRGACTTSHSSVDLPRSSIAYASRSALWWRGARARGSVPQREWAASWGVRGVLWQRAASQIARFKSGKVLSPAEDATVD